LDLIASRAASGEAWIELNIPAVASVPFASISFYDVAWLFAVFSGSGAKAAERADGAVPLAGSGVAEGFATG